MDAYPARSQPHPTIVAREEGDHALLAVKSLLQHAGVGPHADGDRQGHVSAAPFQIAFFGLDGGKVHEPDHPAAGYAPRLLVAYPLLDHLSTLPSEQERGMAIK